MYIHWNWSFQNIDKLLYYAGQNVLHQQVHYLKEYNRQKKNSSNEMLPGN